MIVYDKLKMNFTSKIRSYIKDIQISNFIGEKSFVNFSFWILFILFFSYSFYLILKYKLNMPYADEWAMFNRARRLDHEFNTIWLFATTNAHPMVIHRIISWLLLEPTGWDYRVQALIQLPLIAAATWYFLRWTERLTGIGMGFFAASLFAASHAENFMWPHQLLFPLHYIIMFFAAGLIACGKSRPIIWGYILIAFSIFQSGMGLPAAAAIAVIGIWFAIARPETRHLHIIGVGLVVATSVTWILGFHRDNSFEVSAWPTQAAFYQVLHNLAANGIGAEWNSNEGLGWEWYGSILVVIAIPLLASTLILRSGFLRHADRATDFALIFGGAAVAVAISIALSRGLPGGYSGYADRYYPVGLQLLAGALLLSLALVKHIDRKLVANGVILVLCGTLFVTLIPKLNFEEEYRSWAEIQRNQITCTRAYIAGEVDTCGQFGGPFPKQGGPYDSDAMYGLAQRAAELNASFCFTIMNDHQDTTVTAECWSELLEAWRTGTDIREATGTRDNERPDSAAE